MNTSRGGIVDQDARGRCSPDHRRRCARRVHPEPLAADSPLREMENVVLPHFAGMSRDSHHGPQMIEESIRRLRGQPRGYVVNKDMLERA